MATISDNGQPDFQRDLAAIIEAVQEQRSVLVLAVRELQLNARLLMLEEARRLKAERDPADARAARFDNGSAVILRRVAALEVEAQIASIRVPPVTKTATLLQGRVTDEASRATAHVTVTLIDDTGKPLANVAPVETDDAGYYAFVLQAEQTEAIGADRKLTLQIGSGGGKLLVPAAAVPVTLAPGKVVAAEMRLQASELDALHLRPAFDAVRKPTPPAEDAKSAGKPRQSADQDAKPKKKP